MMSQQQQNEDYLLEPYAFINLPGQQPDHMAVPDILLNPCKPEFVATGDSVAEPLSNEMTERLLRLKELVKEKQAQFNGSLRLSLDEDSQGDDIEQDENTQRLHEMIRFTITGELPKQ